MNLPSKKVLDLTDQRYGHLKLVAHVRNNTNRKAIWSALCDCGNTTEVLADKARRGLTTSCGCQAKNLAVPMVGKSFGRLKVLAFAGSTKGRAYVWKCLCQCGKETEVNGAKLRNGHTASCGCLSVDVGSTVNLQHGQARIGAKSRAYTAWVSMLRRCTATTGKDAKDYALRGITVCAAWRSFPAFFAEMGECPPKLTLEREDVNGNYERSNCVWASRKVQANNKQTTVRFSVEGQMLTVTQAAELWGVSFKVAKKRLMAATQPLRTQQ